MYVRIARFEGGGLGDEEIGSIRKQMQAEPPPGLEGARRALVLVDRQNGRGLAMTFFDTEEDMRRGDEALNAMSPGGDARRTSVELYEVAIEQQF